MPSLYWMPPRGILRRPPPAACYPSSASGKNFNGSVSASHLGINPSRFSVLNDPHIDGYPEAFVQLVSDHGPFGRVLIESCYDQ